MWRGMRERIRFLRFSHCLVLWWTQTTSNPLPIMHFWRIPTPVIVYSGWLLSVRRRNLSTRAINKDDISCFSNKHDVFMSLTHRISWDTVLSAAFNWTFMRFHFFLTTQTTSGWKAASQTVFGQAVEISYVLVAALRKSPVFGLGLSQLHPIHRAGDNVSHFHNSRQFADDFNLA